MNKATEDTLAILHSRVADTMISALDQADEASALLVEFQDELPNKVRRFLEDCRVINPSLLTAATKFLKDNDISVEPDSLELNDLEERLKKKRKQGSITSIPLE